MRPPGLLGAHGGTGLIVFEKSVCTVRVATTSGAVIGSVNRGVSTFTGVRYGKLTAGRRFDPVSASDEWLEQDLRSLPAVFPQLPSRLRGLMGAAVEAHPQEEDAFLLNIWAPENLTDLPVLFLVHGGAFVSGGAGVRWYDGSRLASEGRMVVVSANYRLGSLAHLSLSPEDDPNRALSDLRAALQWVRININSFGGDPGRITLAGQSAGAFLAKLIAVLPGEREKLSGLALMSCPNIPAATRAETSELSREVIAGLEGGDPIKVAAFELLESHRRAMVAHRRLGRVGMGLMPTAVGHVPGWLNDPKRVASELRVTNLLTTTTRHETSAFFFAGAERQITRDQLTAMDDCHFIGKGDPYWELVETTTAQRFRDPARELAAAAAERGIKAHYREFPIESPLDGVGGTHGFDLPFLFGNWDDWRDAPMMNGVGRDVFDHESRKVRMIVTHLVHGSLGT